MIDWVSALLPLQHKHLQAGAVIKVMPDGDVEWSCPCAISVLGSYQSSFLVKSVGSADDDLASHLYISGNPSKFLQGHNVFGSDDLLSLVFDTFLKLIDSLSITPNFSDFRAIKKGDYEITRIDINYSFELNNRKDVNAWIRSAELFSKTRHGRPSLKSGTIYWGKHSRRWAIKAYSKGDEIEKHKLPVELQDTLIVDWADNKLRVELVLRSKELKEKLTNKAKYFTEEFIKQIYFKYIESLQMKKNVYLSDDLMNELPSRLLSTYTLWKNSHDLRSVLSHGTYYRHRKELLSFGINIDFLPANKSPDNVVPLIRVLEAKPAEIPGFAFEQKLIHHSAYN